MTNIKNVMKLSVVFAILFYLSINIFSDKTENHFSLFPTSTDILAYSTIPSEEVNADISILSEKRLSHTLNYTAESKDVLKVIPGGQSIGIDLNTNGVLVVGYHQIKSNEEILKFNQSDIKVGDLIINVDDEEITSVNQLKKRIKQSGKENKMIELKIKRGEEIFNTNIEPIFDEIDQDYRIGLYIRDTASGIGTMTFVEPISKKYGALGHVISDVDTKRMIEIKGGKLMRSNVTSIDKGENGNPGEKHATYTSRDHEIGIVNKNTPFGVFGTLTKDFNNRLYKEPIEIGFSDEIKQGPAKILTVLKGEKVEAFDIEIISNTVNKYPATKGIVVKVTDERLLAETGGIVQGMSGSPIIQDNKIIGAITHVFINDPKSGYGVHIEWMLNEVGIKKEEISGLEAS